MPSGGGAGLIGDVKDEILRQLHHAGKAADLWRHCFSAASRAEGCIQALDRGGAGRPASLGTLIRVIGSNTWVERPDDAAFVLHAGS
jgi:hypothetical protein